MIKVDAKKDGNGNIIITENSFEMLLACLDNQKFVHESPQNGDSIAVGEKQYRQTQESIQSTIDEYNRASRKILHQKYIFGTTHNGLSLYKKYEHQDFYTPWSENDVSDVYQLFKDTNYWIIERPIRYNNEYLTISEDGNLNRQWTEDEILKITELLH